MGSVCCKKKKKSEEQTDELTIPLVGSFDQHYPNTEVQTLQENYRILRKKYSNLHVKYIQLANNQYTDVEQNNFSNSSTLASNWRHA